MSGALTRLVGRGGTGTARGADSNTVFLCRFDTTTPTDQTDNSTGTLVGNATCDTANSRLTLDGTGDWVTFPHKSGFDFSGDLTIEFYSDIAGSQVGGLVCHGASGSGRWAVYCDGSSRLQLYCDNIAGGGQGGSMISGLGAPDGSRHHFAFCRDGNNWRLYKDGAQFVPAISTAGTIGTINASLFIGTDPASTTTRDVNCHIERVELSNICRYPNGTGFTPPT